MELWILLAFLSAISFAIKDIITKKCFNKYTKEPTQLLFEQRFVIFSLLLLFLFPFIDFYSFYSHFFLFMLKAISLFSAAIVYLILLKKYELSLISPLTNLSPLFLLVLTSLFLGEVITFVQFIGILVMITGTYILELTHHNHDRRTTSHFHFKDLLSRSYSFYILVAIMLLSFSLTTIMDRIILTSGIGIYTNLYFTSLIVFFMTFAYLMYERKIVQTIKKVYTEPQTLVLGAITLIDEIIITSAISIPNAILSVIIPIRRTSTLFASLFGGLLFHESHLKQKVFAISIMILGIILITVV